MSLGVKCVFATEKCLCVCLSKCDVFLDETDDAPSLYVFHVRGYDSIFGVLDVSVSFISCIVMISG